MMDNYRRRLVAEYIGSVRNEVAIEMAFLDAMGKPRDHCGYMPRSPRWLNYPETVLQLVRASAPLLRWVWSALGFWGCVGIEWIRALKKLAATGNRTAASRNFEHERCLFGASDRAFQVTSSSAFSGRRMARLYCPWIEREVEASSDTAGLSLLELVDREDLWACLQLTVVAHARLRSLPDLKIWVMQDYTAFRWFMTRIALTRVSTHWITTEHYDRWAVLLDGVVKQMRRSAGPSGSPEQYGFTLIQHGSMNPLSGSGSTPVFPELPYRLSCVSDLHVYSEATAEGFKQYVLSRRGAAELKAVHLFKPTVVLSPVDPLDATKVLFIGHSACEDFHLRVLAELEAEQGLICLYKPHPKSPMSRKAAAASWQIIDDPLCYPECELAIAYPSTLAIEYQEAGVNVIQHGMDEPPTQATRIARQVAAALEHRHASLKH